MTPKVHEVWFVLFDDLRGRRSFRLPPDEIHLRVDRAEREPGLEDQQYATVKEKTRARQAETHWYQVMPRVAGERDDADRDARGDEHSQTQVKRHHATLQQTRPTR